MRTAYAVGATWILVLALAVGMPAELRAAPQNEADKGAPAATDGNEPEAATPTEEPASEGAGTAQGFAVPTGFGRLLDSVQVDGEVQVGYRFVDVNGSEDKYREHYDFDDGVRILSSRVVVSPEQRGPDRAFDRITLSANGLGGDPYEMWNIAAYKTGAYRANVRFRSVDYFYGDPGDVHHWDMRREYVDVNLSANLASNVVVDANFNRYRGSGDRTTTRDFDRDEFHYDEPLDQEGTDYGFGIRWNLAGTDLFFQQQFVNFRDNAGFTSVANPGGPTTTFVEMLANTEVRAMDAPISRGGFHSVVADNRVELYGDVIYSDQQTSTAFTQALAGTNRFGQPIETTWTNQGLVEREVLHGNFEARFRAHERVVLTARYSHRDWDQDGSSIAQDLTVLTASDEGDATGGVGLSSYRVQGDQVLFGAEFAPDIARGSANIFGEVGYSSVDKAFDKSEIGSFPHGSERETDVTTTSVPFRIGGFYRPDQRVDVKFTYSRADVDDPLTQVFPTVTDAIKLRTRFRPLTGWTATASFTSRDAQNDLSEYQFDSKSFAAGLSYAFTDRGHAGIGYTYLDSSASVPFIFVLDDRSQGESVADYEAQSNVFTLSGRYNVADPADVYGSLSYVDNDGSIPLSRFDVLFGGRYTLPNGIFFDGQLRFLDYQQEFFHEQGIILSPPEPSSANDYDAKLFTFSVGFLFN